MVERVERGQLRELGDDVVGRVEQEPGVGGEQHRRVVVGVAGRDHPVVERAEGLDRRPLLVGHPQPVAGDAAVGDLEAMAQQGGPSELTHQRARELLEGVGEDDHLGALPQPGEEVDGSGQGLE